MPDNGFHFPLQIRMPMRIIIQRLQFFYQRRAILYPTVKGFYRIVLCAVRIVKQGQFGFQVRTKLKHHSWVLALFIFCKVKKIKLLALIEIVLPCFMLAQVVGRWGNFMNQEAFGPLVNGYTSGPLTDLELLAQRETLRHLLVPNFVIDNMYITPDYSLDIPRITGYYYPTFYFESILNLIGAVGYIILRKKSNKIYLYLLMDYNFILLVPSFTNIERVSVFTLCDVTIKIFCIATTIPRFNAYERCVFLYW